MTMLVYVAEVLGSGTRVEDGCYCGWCWKREEKKGEEMMDGMIERNVPP